MDVSQLCGEGRVLLLQVPVDVSQLCGEGKVLLAASACGCVTVVWGGKGLAGYKCLWKLVTVVWGGKGLAGCKCLWMCHSCVGRGGKGLAGCKCL